MSQKIHRTAQGKMIDFGHLEAANENVIAVGNMKVNARGDELGPGGKIIRTRNQIMEDQYQVTNQQMTAIKEPIVEYQPPQSAAADIVPDVIPDAEDPLTDEEIAALKKVDAAIAAANAKKGKL